MCGINQSIIDIISVLTTEIRKKLFMKISHNSFHQRVEESLNIISYIKEAKIFNILFARTRTKTTRTVFRNWLFILLFVNCLQNHLSSNFWYYIPNSGTNKRCCMSIVIYRFKILAFYQKLMSEILTSIFRSKNLQFWQTDAI